MNDAEFQTVLDGQLAAINATLKSKGEEYARGDRLSNFKKAAALQGITPERALLGMLTKHIVSVMDLVGDIDTGKVAPLPQWAEKIGDSINYHILLKALIHERLESGK